MSAASNYDDMFDRFSAIREAQTKAEQAMSRALLELNAALHQTPTPALAKQAIGFCATLEHPYCCLIKAQAFEIIRTQE